MWVSWREATRRALYEDGGFYREERPSAHFRTSVHASPLFAEAIARLLARVDVALGHPPRLDFVDMGAGDGLLAAGVLAAFGGTRLRVVAVDLAPRPDGLPSAIEWAEEPPEEITGLIVANEWLDNVPLDVVEQADDGPRLVLVDPETGAETLGPPLTDPADLAWLAAWWPLPRTGSRAEIGRPRDEAWSQLLVRLTRGTCVAIDYAHTAADRPELGTLTGYRNGHAVAPVPDGTRDITAHVALDACARGEGLLTTQREALRDLGVTGARPPLGLASSDPRGYLRALARASAEAELIDPGGLGGFGWLQQVR
ncbi:SAM-dependent methyltransferase [Herbidospora mongoliensis]|uniref:SAM-dependent methyltransferase n=1 Tax=Herbidospora mongoliensis TaxID=688067 RepID=UPI00082D0004|nr:SAM-dependent methyltransferase [Herbidospora mongoliensis]